MIPPNPFTFCRFPEIGLPKSSRSSHCTMLYHFSIETYGDFGSSRSHLSLLKFHEFPGHLSGFCLTFFQTKSTCEWRWPFYWGVRFWVVVATIGFNTKLWSSLSLHHITSPCEVDDPRVWCLRGVVPKCIPNKFLGAKLFWNYIPIISSLYPHYNSNYNPNIPHHITIMISMVLMLWCLKSRQNLHHQGSRHVGLAAPCCCSALSGSPPWSALCPWPAARQTKPLLATTGRMGEKVELWILGGLGEWRREKTLIWTDLNMYWEKMW